MTKQKSQEAIMAIHVQYDLFKETTDLDVIQTQLSVYKETLDNVRKGLFARHNEILKLVLRQQEEIDYLRCKMGLSSIIEAKSQLR